MARMETLRVWAVTVASLMPASSRTFSRRASAGPLKLRLLRVLVCLAVTGFASIPGVRNEFLLADGV